MKNEEITDISEDRVPDVVKNYIRSGATKIIATKQNNGKWTITAE